MLIYLLHKASTAADKGDLHACKDSFWRENDNIAKCISHLPGNNKIMWWISLLGNHLYAGNYRLSLPHTLLKQHSVRWQFHYPRLEADCRNYRALLHFSAWKIQCAVFDKLWQMYQEVGDLGRILKDNSVCFKLNISVVLHIDFTALEMSVQTCKFQSMKYMK